jgi:hypothetical protein
MAIRAAAQVVRPEQNLMVIAQGAIVPAATDRVVHAATGLSVKSILRLLQAGRRSGQLWLLHHLE